MKEDFREIVLNIKIVILEGMVLFGIEHFEQSRARVATEVGAKFIDFVKQENRINCPGLLHHLNDLARQRADVGATMAANLCFVTHAAERQAHKLPAGSPSDGFTEARFANSRWANKTKNRSLGILYQLTHGEIFENSLLDLLQAVSGLR